MPEALAVMESTLLTDAAEEHVSHSAPIAVDCDEEEQPILMCDRPGREKGAPSPPENQC